MVVEEIKTVEFKRQQGQIIGVRMSVLLGVKDNQMPQVVNGFGIDGTVVVTNTLKLCQEATAQPDIPAG